MDQQISARYVAYAPTVRMTLGLKELDIMKSKVKLGTIIATRRMIAADTGRRVTISIGTPQYVGDGWDWVCPFRISGIGKPICGHVHGVDALQSLQLVTLGIRAELEQSRRPFTFLGESFWQTAFPAPIRDLGIPELSRRLEKLIVTEQTKWISRKKGVKPPSQQKH